jgi:hypothetical protein
MKKFLKDNGMTILTFVFFVVWVKLVLSVINEMIKAGAFK